MTDACVFSVHYHWPSATIQGAVAALSMCDTTFSPSSRFLQQDVKLDVGRDESLSSAVNEIAEIKSCNSCVFLECRKKTDLYLWAGKAPNGPSAK